MLQERGLKQIMCHKLKVSVCPVRYEVCKTNPSEDSIFITIFRWKNQDLVGQEAGHGMVF